MILKLFLQASDLHFKLPTEPHHILLHRYIKLSIVKAKSIVFLKHSLLSFHASLLPTLHTYTSFFPVLEFEQSELHSICHKTRLQPPKTQVDITVFGTHHSPQTLIFSSPWQTSSFCFYKFNYSQHSYGQNHYNMWPLVVGYLHLIYHQQNPFMFYGYFI